MIAALLRPTKFKRAFVFALLDVAVFALSMFAAFALRFDGDVPLKYERGIVIFFVLAIAPKLLANQGFRLYRLTWRFVSIREVASVIPAALLGSMGFGMLSYLFHVSLHVPSLPRSILILDCLLSMTGVALVRMARRIYQVGLPKAKMDATARRVLVVGAGRSGERLLREMTHSTTHRTVGIIDDDPAKLGSYIHGIRVLGGREAMPIVIKDERVDEVVVAMTAPGSVIRSVVSTARKAGAPLVRVMPGPDDLLSGRVIMSQIRDVNVEDLLGRKQVALDVGAVGEQLYGRTVLVTGAAGSIGSELALLIAQFEPGRLILIDKDETRLFGLDLDLRQDHPRVALFPVLADVRNRDRMAQVFETFKPQVVFHAAAYKHVPMMEAHPQEAVTDNVLGTRVLAEVAAAAGTETFVLISTDKAVNPSSIMGATKRVAEMIIRRLNEVSATRFMAVRFGNVLGSRGSLLPILEEQIRRGGPITVTDPSMERYFMTVHEAVRLILKAATIGGGGEVLTLDMGELVRVLDLVEALVQLSGLEPDVDVAITFTGARPGEKLVEELVLAEEGIVATADEQIFIAQLGSEPDPAALDQSITLLEEAARAGDTARIQVLLRETVRTYRPAASRDEPLTEILEGPTPSQQQAQRGRGAD